MSGLFQRIARRPADPPDGESGREETDAPTQTLPVAPPASPPPASTGGSPTELLAPVAAPQAAPIERRPGFRERGRMRRRLRYLRKLRELQVRDLGGLTFDLRRFERKRDDLVAQKIDQIRACDDELRALELALDERRDVRDVREPGIGGICPRCFAIHGSSDRFCASCGAAFAGGVQGPTQVAPVASPPAAGPPAASPPPVTPPPASPPPVTPPSPVDAGGPPR
jgi:hypothetical protein